MFSEPHTLRGASSGEYFESLDDLNHTKKPMSAFTGEKSPHVLKPRAGAADNIT